MDIGTAAQWGSLFVAALALIYTVASARSRVSQDQLAKKASADDVAVMHTRLEVLATRLDGVEDRVTRAEGELEHMPDRDTTHRLEMAIARLEGRMETMDERLKPIAEISRRLQDMVMENKLK
ncbi:MAG: DUF2730 family protein [Hyphomicrobiaceae bacterium]|nr:DUF2730 family protein [Hyphomicrobiaceae bacterium]